MRAVVSRGGRPDLAGEALRSVKAPTLLIVGERDEQVLELNREALDALQCPKQLSIVPGATHLFEETGALEEVARLATRWFEGCLLHEGFEDNPFPGNLRGVFAAGIEESRGKRGSSGRRGA